VDVVSATAGGAAPAEAMPSADRGDTTTGLAEVVAPDPQAMAETSSHGEARRGASARPAARVEPYVLPLDELQRLAEQAGLHWAHSDPERIAAAQAAIAELTRGYDQPADYYVDRLREGMARIAAAFYPRPVTLRFSDFKSNEYARLLGGAAFEPQEENPMLGWRGASRYYAPAFRQAFALECLALRQVRQEMGLTNVIPMVPFCRTPEEGDRVLAEMARSGLVRGENGLQVYVMCELPSNVIAAEAFAERFDGFSIGSNDLTQLTLGLDRDSALVADLFDERHPTVQEMIRLAIRTAHRCGRPIGLCGQAPSDYPDFARFLVQEGIDSISLNPDALVATRLTIAQLEAELAAHP
jgi:pyruvate,water dikinase